MVVNSGNSRVGVGVFVAGELQEVLRADNADKAGIEKAIADNWAKIKERENAAVAGCGVNPPMMAELDKMIERATGQKMEWVGKGLDYPIEVKTDHPNETGADRILNVAAAYEQMGKACVVVDAGTAITIDLCNDEGHFLGGAIAPGVGLMLDAMHNGTAKLPKVELEEPAAPWGKNTKQAMVHGVYYGIRGMLKEIVENYATELGEWPDVIATGGDAQKLFEGWELIHAVSPDLVYYGIALAFSEHHIKHND